MRLVRRFYEGLEIINNTELSTDWIRLSKKSELDNSNNNTSYGRFKYVGNKSNDPFLLSITIKDQGSKKRIRLVLQVEIDSLYYKLSEAESDVKTSTINISDILSKVSGVIVIIDDDLDNMDKVDNKLINKVSKKTTNKLSNIINSIK